MKKWLIILLLASETHTAGNFVKETAKEVGGELIKLGITSLAEAALDSLSDDDEDACDGDNDWWWWLKGNRIKNA